MFHLSISTLAHTSEFFNANLCNKIINSCRAVIVIETMFVKPKENNSEDLNQTIHKKENKNRKIKYKTIIRNWEKKKKNTTKQKQQKF